MTAFRDTRHGVHANSRSVYMEVRAQKHEYLDSTGFSGEGPVKRKSMLGEESLRNKIQKKRN